MLSVSLTTKTSPLQWFATLLGPGVANAEVAAAPGKSLDSIDQWSRLVSGGGENPRTEVVLRNDPGMWGFREHRTWHVMSCANESFAKRFF